MNRMNKVAEYYDRQAADYHKQYEGTSGDYPANAIRLKHVISRLRALKAKSVFEIGVGEGTPLVEIAKLLGIAVAGCDISPEMVGQAKANFVQSGLDSEDISLGDAATWAKNHMVLRDAVIATGVLPHTDDDSLIADIRGILKPGGSAIVEFRNSLFSLFTFNRHTISFFMDELLAGVGEPARAQVYDFLLSRVILSSPPKSEFDEISRFHNPFELQNTFAKHGFQTTGFIWYHAHPAPPCLEKGLEEEFRKEALNLEKGDDWRGMFMCSAGLIEVKK